MNAVQRERAFGLLAASSSAKGLEKTRNIMRLNHYLAGLRQNFEEYGEGRYHLTLMGAPSATEPWGWQLDGHLIEFDHQLPVGLQGRPACPTANTFIPWSARRTGMTPGRNH